MLLKFAGVKTQYAIGLRWAVDDRSGIETIQFNTDLHYGVMLSIKEKISNKLKLVALADQSHNKAICLAGLLASRYKDLIFAHRISDSVYWACVIRNNTVWTGADVPKATAGDYVGSFVSVGEIIEIAKTSFIADGVDLQGILMCSDTASEDFPDFQAVDFFSFITKLKKDRAYTVRYLQPSKILYRKIAVLVVVIIVSISTVYYVQQQRLVTRLLYQQQIEQERQRQLAIQEKANYFTKIQRTIQTKTGYVVVKNVLNILNLIPLQSQGWNLASATYITQTPHNMRLRLTRSDYGTLDSFLYAYSKTPMNGVIDSDNNSGVKTLAFNRIALNEANIEIPENNLTQSIPTESYRLISYMQLSKELYNFKVKSKSSSRYGVYSTEFQIAGEKLWQLVQFESVLKRFPTLVIKSITFAVDNDYDMSWTIEGEIYA
ncbi:MAG: hypothetical protein V4496_04440 [Pseudomonadota bacterium]